MLHEYHLFLINNLIHQNFNDTDLRNNFGQNNISIHLYLHLFFFFFF